MTVCFRAHMAHSWFWEQKNHVILCLLAWTVLYTVYLWKYRVTRGARYGCQRFGQKLVRTPEVSDKRFRTKPSSALCWYQTQGCLGQKLEKFRTNAVPPNRSGSNKITHNLSYALSLFMRLLMTDFYECIFVNCSASASVLYIKPICRIQNIPFFLYKKSFNFK